MNERRQRSHVIRQFLAFVPEGLNLGLGGRVGDREPADLAIRVAECDRGQRGAVGSHRPGGCQEPGYLGVDPVLRQS
jgi:hypothetical protein